MHDVQCIGDLGTGIIIIAILSAIIAMHGSYHHFARSLKNIALKDCKSKRYIIDDPRNILMEAVVQSSTRLCAILELVTADVPDPLIL